MLTPDNELLVFGGHGEKKDLEGFRVFDGSSGKLHGGGMVGSGVRGTGGEERVRVVRVGAVQGVVRAEAGGKGAAAATTGSKLHTAPELVARFTTPFRPCVQPSGRWYPTPVTLPDGKVMVVGGVKKNGQTG